MTPAVAVAQQPIKQKARLRVCFFYLLSYNPLMANPSKISGFLKGLLRSEKAALPEASYLQKRMDRAAITKGTPYAEIGSPRQDFNPSGFLNGTPKPLKTD